LATVVSAEARKESRGAHAFFRRAFAPLVLMFGQEPIDIARGKLRYRLRPSMNVAERGILLNPLYQAGSLGFLRGHLPPGGQMVDCGANVGQFSLAGAEAVGPGGKVLAVEASPEMAARLAVNIALSGMEKIIDVAEVAVGDAEGVISFHINEADGALSRADPAGRHKITMRPLWELVTEAGLSHNGSTHTPEELADDRRQDWPKPEGATNVREFRIYRWSPDDEKNPRHRHLLRRYGRLRPDGARRAHLDQEQCRSDADLPPLLPRGHLRLLRDEHRRHQHAGLHQGHGRGAKGAVKIYPLPHMPVIKDLVPDLSNFYAQHALHRALAANGNAAAPEASGSRAMMTAPSSTGFTSASCAPAARQAARATGGTATAISARRCFCRPIAG
jgi:FkbM family methyltransferase